MEAGSKAVAREGRGVSTLPHIAHEQFDSPTYVFPCCVACFKIFHIQNVCQAMQKEMPNKSKKKPKNKGTSGYDIPVCF